jgi:hypothetical protein
VLIGYQVSNSTPVPATFQVTYTWDKDAGFLDRAVARGSTAHAATDVSAFSWYVDANSTVVVNMTVTVQAYSQSQTFRFYPRTANP